MDAILKQCLGIDVSKLSLSLSLGYLTNDLSKKFESHLDVSNDLTGYRTLVKWLEKSLAWLETILLTSPHVKNSVKELDGVLKKRPVARSWQMQSDWPRKPEPRLELSGTVPRSGLRFQNKEHRHGPQP